MIADIPESTRSWRMRGTWRSWLAWGVGLTCFVVVVRQIQVEILFSTLTHMRAWPLMIAVVLNFTAFVAAAARWRLLFESHSTPSLWRFTEALFVAQLLNTTLPGRSGAVARAHLVSRRQDFDMGYVLGTVFVEKLIEGISLGPLVLLVLPHLPVLAGVPTMLGLGLLGLALVGFTLSIIRVQYETISSLFYRMSARIPFLRHVDLLGAVRSAANGVSILGRSSRNPMVWVLSAFIWLTVATTYYATMIALGVEAPFTAAWVLVILVQIGARIPTLPAGVGLIHYLVILGLSPFAVDPSLALSVGVVLHTLVFILPSIVGAFVLWRR